MREQRLVQFYAHMLESFANTNSIESLFLLDRVTPTIDFPCIITDSVGNPLEPFEQFTLNITFPSHWDSTRRQEYLRSMIAEMGQEYPPIEIRDDKGNVINFIYYTNSWVVKRLRILPFAEIAIVALFIAAGYIALMLQRRRDESLIWVGMAKETAHQLGTPISSMLGWIEILNEQLHSTDSGQRSQAWKQPLDELQHDIQRLKDIAQRFSLIGSQPKLQRNDLTTLINETVQYVNARLPRHGKRITIEFHALEEPCLALVNPELFSWVLENLLKNAVEAIDAPSGTIRITMHKATRRSRGSENIVRITIADTGRGMTATQRRYAFTAGFTTKERGWGLGLSLARRIIEEYHKGKIYILRTAPNHGTTVAIELPIEDV